MCWQIVLCFIVIQKKQPFFNSLRVVFTLNNLCRHQKLVGENISSHTGQKLFIQFMW